MSTLKNSRYSRRYGFTLTELAIVLGVVGTILGGIFVASAKVNASNKTQRAAAQVAQVINNYRTLYAQHSVDGAAGWQDVTCMGVNAKFFPPEMVQSACTAGNTATYPVSPWGGGSYVKMYAMSDNNTLLIEYNNLTQAACNSFADNIYAASDIVYEAIYNGTWTSQWVTPFPGGTGPSYTASQINNICGTTNVVQAGFTAR